MLYQDYFQFMDVWSAVELGLYFTVIGYYVLLFAFFGLIKFRTSKKIYWLFFAILPIMLAIGRVFLSRIISSFQNYRVEEFLLQILGHC